MAHGTLFARTGKLRNCSIKSCRKGSAAVEFALVAPVLVTMVFGMLEFSFIMFSYSAMQTAARDVARQVSVNTMSAGAVESALSSKVPGWMGDAVDVEITQSDPGDPQTNIITLRATALASEASPISLFSKVDDWEIETEVQMKQELPFEDFEAEDD